ncbi:MAG: GGDEF domain-containing protein [Myxococcales bacterium]
MHLKVAEIVDPEVMCVTGDRPLSSLVGEMARDRREATVVVDGARPTGILTERDVVRLSRAVLTGELDKHVPVALVMSRPPLTVPLDADVEAAMGFFDRHQIRHAVVVGAAGELAGLLTQGALLRAHARLLLEERQSIKPDVARRTAELMREKQELQALATHDQLTGVLNRRALDAALAEIGRSRREQPRALIMLDLDHFKAFNDRYGHLAGDEALRSIAHALQDALRAPDLVYRYGGEEFVVVLDHTDVAGARATAWRLVSAVRALALHHEGAEHGVMTVSAGVAELRPGQDAREALGRADQALYAAKQAGRDRVAHA